MTHNRKALVASLALAVFGASPLVAPRALAQTAPAGLVAEKQSTDFTNILPADDTAAVFVMQNFFKYAAFDAKTPMARLLAHPAVKQWTDELLPKQLPDSGELREILGLTEKDLPRLFTGKGVVAMLLEKADAKKDEAASGAKAPEGAKVVQVKASAKAEPVALIEFRGSAAEYERLADKLEAYLKEKDKAADILRERAEGLLIHAYETDNPLLKMGAGEKRVKLFHALHNGTLIVTRDKSRLLDTVRARSRGAVQNPLSGRSDFIAVKQEMGVNDGFFLANLVSLMPVVDDAIRQTLEQQLEANPAAKAFLSPDTAVDALALRNFTSVYGSLNLDENRLEARYGMTWKDRSGLVSLINFGKDPVSVPAYVSADYKGLDVSTVDFPATFDAGSELVRAVSPGGYGMISMLLAQQPDVENALAALRKGVLDNMRPDMVTLTGYATATPAADEDPGRAYIFNLKDPAAAEAAIESVLALKKDAQGNPEIKPEITEYLGVKIRRFPEIPMPVGAAVAGEDEDGDGDGEAAKTAVKPQTVRPCYAFVGDRLIVSLGSDGLMQGVIGNMKNPGKPLVDDRFKDNLGTLPGVPCSVSYGDLGTYLKTGLNELLRSGKHRKAKLTDADLIKARDACDDLRYYYVGKSYFNEGGLYGRLVVAEQADASK